MSEIPEWLPELTLMSDFDNNWDKYIDAIYRCFKRDFIYNKPIYRGLRISLKRYPIKLGKEATFWHLISSGFDEKSRACEIRRCERILWPRSIIENSEMAEVKCWENIRKGERRILLWLEAAEYLVVLAKRKGHILLWTAYLVTEDHRKDKLRKEYKLYKKASAAK